ncbi:MAG: Modification methylase PaeR7I [Microgenomates group bacterium ADurb.Bin238]|nr:MAG: Modification methylase PaeR7I [Microgenomates group bacterium ADurb.Bin238]
MNDAREILESIIDEFSVEKFTRLFREKSHKFTPREENYSHYNDHNFIGGIKIGEINFSDVDSLLICSFEVTKALSERAGKKAQYEKAKSILKTNANQRFSAGIFIFYDNSGNFRFSLVYPESIGVKRQWNNFRRFTYFVSREFTNKTFLKQLGGKEFTNLEDVKDAFSITAVTDLFYDEFFKIYDKLVSETKVINNIDTEEKARDFVLLFVIRTIFLGFIQKKRWIGDDEKFIQSFYLEYKNKFYGNNEFYKRWLSPLFFEALNSPPGREVAYRDNDFSNETETKLQMAPYLNGGLFRKKQEFDTSGWLIPDGLIEEFFNFLFSHSFTIEENSLEDEDLQLNPEFLGIIFERLVNKADGAVYTPRPEVDLMCRLSLVKWLQKNLEIPLRTENLYELFFRESEKDEDQKQGSFSEKEARHILDKLENLTICDPAVGSGAFLVGMMQVLDDVEQSLRKRYEIDGKNLFERKKQIIKSSLYGVEVKEWAVWICQLRLWLSLFVDAPDELKQSFEPILPSLDFKVRQGDSLVQRVGSKAFPISGHNIALSKSVKDKITKLKNLKLQYFDNKSELKEWELRQKELAIYEEILATEISETEKELRNLKNIKPIRPLSLFGEEKSESEQTELMFDPEKAQALEEEMAELHEKKKLLRNGGKPLVWSIEFADVFGEKEGFDIVIGNPPYVRQEDIADPTGKVKDKKEYKSYLQEMVRLDFPDYFTPKTKLNAKSDLYTYFYIRALRLLNPYGIHTFICSNSWLDVGYGVWLQEFLLNRCPVELIIDNHAKRSFQAADVNTIISIIHAPQKKVDDNHTVKFVAFKKPFESAVFTENLIAIENAREVVTNDTFRVFPISNSELKEAGTEYEDTSQTTLKMGRYVGDKWGGKYLRAPDIYFTILEKGKEKLVKLGDISFSTKRNNLENFNKWLISKDRYISPNTQFPFLHSLKDIKGIKVDINKLKSFKKTNENRNTEYIIADIISNRFVGERSFFIEGGDFLVNDSFFISKLKNQYDKFCVLALLNSSLSLFLLEVLGRKTFAVGVMYIYGPEFRGALLLDPNIVKTEELSPIYTHLREREISTIYKECGIDPRSDTPIEEQEPKPLPDRAELDNIVFDALGLTEEERKDVYRAVCRLVWNRINKANSV